MVSDSELYDQYIGAQMRLQAARTWRKQVARRQMPSPRAMPRFAETHCRNAAHAGRDPPEIAIRSAAGLDKHR